MISTGKDRMSPVGVLLLSLHSVLLAVATEQNFRSFELCIDKVLLKPVPITLTENRLETLLSNTSASIHLCAAQLCATEGEHETSGTEKDDGSNPVNEFTSHPQRKESPMNIVNFLCHGSEDLSFSLKIRAAQKLNFVKNSAATKCGIKGDQHVRWVDSKGHEVVTAEQTFENGITCSSGQSLAALL